MADFIVKGLNKNHYFVNNPIWVDISSISQQAEFLRVRVQAINFAGTNEYPPGSTHQKLYIVNSSASFDMSTIAKGFIARGKHPESPQESSSIGTNYAMLRITLQSVDENGDIINSTAFTKVFIRGGEDTISTNLSASLGEVLKESEKIPRWGSYPVAKYYIGQDSSIKIKKIIPEDETDNRRVIGCDPLYVRFRNTKGGYSFWLFENWAYEKKTKEGESVYSRSGNYETGVKEVQYKISVDGRVERAYYHTMQALAESGEIYIYGIDGLDKGNGAFQRQKNLWTPAKNAGNSIKVVNFKDVDNFSFNFEPMIDNKPSLAW